MTDQLELLEVFNDKCSLLRYSVPVEAIEALQYEGSRYSPEFQIGGAAWRLHLQQRNSPQTNEVFLAVHLQCLSTAGAYGHFRLTMCNINPNNSKSKTFHCHFKKSGSAWGLHQFLSLDRLLNPQDGFLEERPLDASGRRISRRIAIDLVLTVLEAGPDGAYSLGTLPQSSKTFSRQQPFVGAGAFPPQSATPRGAASAAGAYPPPAPYIPPQQQQQPSIYGNYPGAGGAAAVPYPAPQVAARGNATGNIMMGNDLQVSTAEPSAPPPHVKAPLVYPFEHLEALCDMWFDVNGVRIKAHRCVIAARMSVLIPAEMLPLAEGITIAISDSLEVFTAFLRYVYTEDYPEQGVLHPESILDLYLLAARCEFFDLCGVCLRYVRPLLTPDNILPIVLTKYSIGDEVLNALYLHILIENYDVLIQDRSFEEIPGHLFRRLSLILRNKDRLPAVNIPVTRNTLGRQLAALADSGDYADYELRLAGDQYMPAHRYLLASRSVAFSHAFSPRAGDRREPTFDAPDMQFSFRAWQKFLASLYRRTLGDTSKDLSAEDIALIYKMHSNLTLDGQLKREAEMAITPNNSLRVLIYAVRHNVTELRDRAMGFVSSNFHILVQQDPQAWDLIGELPQFAVVSLFRTVTEAAR